MKLEEIKEVLSGVSFSPSNLDMGWDWDIQSTKIYDDKDIVIEKGFSIRSTFMRPDINTGVVEKGYGRWMYIPENISEDGLVKTAWLCAELIVKHELMEAFLYQKSRIFDPHKTVKDLQYNARIFNDTSLSTNEKINTKVDVPDDTGMVTSDTLFHRQNVSNHTQEITEYLKSNLIEKDNKVGDTIKTDISKYIISTNIIYHSPSEKMVRLVNGSSGKIIDQRSSDKYTLSDVKDMLGDMVTKLFMADPSDINAGILGGGFINGEPKEDFWVFNNPNVRDRYIVHSEIDRSFAVINKNGDIVSESGRDMVYENEEYTIDNLNRVLHILKM